MQCSNIKKLENDRGLILERKYDLLCRNIANGEVKSKIPVEEEECIADRTWHACNVTCWNSGYKTGAAVETDLVTIYPTEHFEGICNSDMFVTYHNKFMLQILLGGRLLRVFKRQ